MTRRRSISLIGFALLTALSACTTGPAGPSTPSISWSAHEPTCTGASGEATLQAFVRDFNAGRDDLISTYFADANDFVRWWDPSLPPANEISYSDLGSHLRKLHGDGVRLHAITGFSDRGYEGRGQPDDGGAFSFQLGPPIPDRSGSPASSPGGKGVVDCATAKFKVIVIDQW